VDRGIDGLEATTIDDDEADKASYLLEQLIATLLPFEVVDKAKTVVTERVNDFETPFVMRLASKRV
jgi:hypothetical protein